MTKCPDCGADLYFSGHDHEECPGQGQGCQECGWGCDLDFAPDGDGYCASLDDEEDEDEELVWDETIGYRAP